MGDAQALARTIDERLTRTAALGMTSAIAAARQRLSFDHFADAVLEASRQPQNPS